MADKLWLKTLPRLARIKCGVKISSGCLAIWTQRSKTWQIEIYLYSIPQIVKTHETTAQPWNFK